METKRCSSCKEIKPISEFYRQRRAKDGLSGTCKDCDYRRLIEYRQRHRKPVFVLGYAKLTLDRFGRQCVYCGSTVDVGLDYWQPRERGGQKELGNMVPACKKCIAEKGDKMPYAFLARDMEHYWWIQGILDGLGQKGGLHAF